MGKIKLLFRAISLFFRNCGVIFKDIYRRYVAIYDSKRYGYYGKDVYIAPPCFLGDLSRVYLYDNVVLKENTTILGHSSSRFIMKKNSGAAHGLTVITNNHTTHPSVGQYHRTSYDILDTPKDVVVEEDVWIAANVILLPGVTVGRGAIVGAGSVCRNSPPPYSIVAGNPAKVIGFKYTPEEIIEHEKALYPEEERLPLDKLERNYKRYYLDRIKEISKYIKQ